MLRSAIKTIRFLLRIRNRDRIPKLPRILATEYDSVTDIEARAMARLGIRSPSGLRAAMRRHDVATPDELIELLEHQRPRRNIPERIKRMLWRGTRGSHVHPHAADIRRHVGTSRNPALEARIRAVQRFYRQSSSE